MRISDSLPLFVVLLTACSATHTRSFTVDSVPPGAVININGVFQGETPCKVTAAFKGRRGRIADIDVLPPKDSTIRLFTQSRSIDLYSLPDTGAVIYFDLRLEQTMPLRPYEIRIR